MTQQRKVWPHFLNYKHKIYAVFQFTTLLYVIILIAWFLIVLIALSNESTNFYNEATKTSIFEIEKMLAFQYSGFIHASLLFYLVIILVLFCDGVGLSLTRFKKRNIFDIMFISFCVIPLLSNILALMAQITKLSAFDPEKIDEDEVYSEAWEKQVQEYNAKTGQELPKTLPPRSQLRRFNMRKLKKQTKR